MCKHHSKQGMPRRAWIWLPWEGRTGRARVEYAWKLCKVMNMEHLGEWRCGSDWSSGHNFHESYLTCAGADIHTQSITVSACGVYWFSASLHSCCLQHSWPWPGARGLLGHMEPLWLVSSCCPAAPPGHFLPSHCPQPAAGGWETPTLWPQQSGFECNHFFYKLLVLVLLLPPFIFLSRCCLQVNCS